MDSVKTDRRVKYTRMVIKDSFVKFLKQKPIQKITVKEICEDADVNRATFYSHFTDQYDLLRQIEEEIIHAISDFLKDYDVRDLDLVPVEMIEKILLYIAENAELFDLLLNQNGDLQFQQEVIRILGTQQLIPLIGSEGLNLEDARYIFHFLASGAVGIIQLWLSENLARPAREIASLLLQTAMHGRSSFDKAGNSKNSKA